MKILLDTNILLDVMLAREPFFSASLAVLRQVETGGLEGCLGATTVTTLHYLLSKALGAEKSKREISRLLDFFGVAAVGREVIAAALLADTADFEDAVLAASAQAASMDAIVTRDPDGFAHSPVPAYSPGQLLEILARSEAEPTSPTT